MLPDQTTITIPITLTFDTGQIARDFKARLEKSVEAGHTIIVKNIGDECDTVIYTSDKVLQKQLKAIGWANVSSFLP